MALEEGWRDPAKLQAQLRKQQNFQAELDASVPQQQELQKVRLYGAEGATDHPSEPGSWHGTMVMTADVHQVLCLYQCLARH